MKKIIQLAFCLFLILCAGTMQAQNLLNGWDTTTGTPYDAGWRVDGSVSVTWGALNASSGNRFRTNVGSPVSNGTDPMLYVTAADTKFGYQVTPAAGKIYGLSGKAWRRNGGSGSATFNFYLADNLLATNTVSKFSLTLSGNNVVNTFSGQRLVAPTGFTSGYFLWDVHNNSGTWADAGIWLLNLTELGDAVPVTFDTDGGSTVATQYFLDGESYTITKPADPTKGDGSPFAGWYADEELTVPFNFSTAVTVATAIYAKWENVTVVKAQLSALINTATAAKTGGTAAGQTYLQSAIDAAQTVYDNAASTVSNVTTAISTLNAALVVYHDGTLSNLTVDGIAVSGFSAAIYAYSYNFAANVTTYPTVAATATATSAATVAISQATTLQPSATVTVTAGDGSTQTYTVNFSANYMAGWDGNGIGTTTDKPNAFGWACSSSVTWSDAADATDTYAYRYRDNLGVGRVITHPVNNNVFSYPLQLTGGKVYRFTCNNANMNGTVSTMFGINTASNATGTMLNSQTKTAPTWNSSTSFDFLFTAETTGTYYLVWQTTSGTDRNLAWNFLVTEAGDAHSVTFDTDGGSTVVPQYFLQGTSYQVAEPEEPTKSGFEFAGWYANSSYTALFNFATPVTASTTVYARFVSAANPATTNLTIDNDTVAISAAKYVNITVSGASELYVADTIPMVGSTINLVSDNAWLYFESIIPSKVTSDYLSSIKINGAAFNAANDRISIYGSGTVIIPNGKVAAKHALTAYKGENYTGESMTFEQDKYYRTDELGTFDNSIRSFKLKKGYSCTFANNPNGTGFSRVFIASDADLEVPAMPEGLEFASFVRVFRWEWTGKKGWAGSPSSQVNVSISYDWGAGASSENMDTEYVPMRHNLGWDSFTTINSRTNVSHVLGYNEPDRSDQSNVVVGDAISQWPELFKSGLRIGSPAPASTNGTSWLNRFMDACDSLNYRVDFMVTHAYQYQAASWWTWYIDLTARGNRASAAYRPVWITEWNNGANWTSESWPTASGPQRDADLNIIYDGEGNTTTVNKPLSPENSAQSVSKMNALLPLFDSSDLLEHHFLYNWVQDARSMELNGKLTPAGKTFAAYKSQVGFKKSKEYIHTWRIAPPWITTQLSVDCKHFTLNWYDHNGETGKYYVLERKLEGEADFSALDTLKAVSAYTYGGNVAYVDSIEGKSAQYRVKAMSYKNIESIYSRVISLNLDTVIAAPANLQGTTVSSSIIDLSWSKVANARSYNLKRATAIGGTYQTISAYMTDTLYRDDSLDVNTTYYYKVSALNNRGETTDSDPVAVTTKTVTVPAVVSGLFPSASDAQAVITWDYQYDALFRVYRSDSENGTFVKVADNLTDTRYADTGLADGQTYYYKVTAFNTAGECAAGAALGITPVAGQYAYFNLDESTGVTAHDLWGGYHGTLYNTAVSSGQTGNAVSFTAANQSYVHLRNGLTSELNDFTISFWINSTTKGSRIFDFGEDTNVFMMLSPGLRYKITCPAGTYDKTVTGYTLPTGQWTYMTLTQEGTTFKMYMNGMEIFSDATATVKPSDMGTNTKNFLVRSHWGSDSYSTCSIDEFRVYNRALNAGEVNALMNGSVYAAELSENVLMLREGDTHQLLVKNVFPDNAHVSTLLWYSDNEAVAGVSEGLVSAASVGTADIHLTTGNGATLATCNVIVSATSGVANGVDSKVNVSVKNNVLIIESSHSETVEVYNTVGQLLVKKDKQSGICKIVLSQTDKVLVVKGSRGWTAKVLK